MRRLLTSLLFLPLCALFVGAGAVHGQPAAPSTPEAPATGLFVVDVLIEDAVLALGTTDPRLQHLAAGAFDAVAAGPGLRLDVGDTLLADEGSDVEVRLRCTESADVRLAEGFEAVVLPAGFPTDLACNILVLRGAAHVQTDEPTRLQTGETVMGSRSTQYGARIVPTEAGVVEEILVFEGDVVVHAGDRSAARTVAAGEKLTITPGELKASTLETADILRTASVYARLDVAARGGTADDDLTPRALDRDTTRRLARSYALTLTHPDDPKARLELATQQLDAGLPAWTSIYQLDRAVDGFEAREAKPELAQSVALRAFAFEERGDREQASRELDRAVAIDPEVLERVQITGRRPTVDMDQRWVPAYDSSHTRWPTLGQRLDLSVETVVDPRRGSVILRAKVTAGGRPVDGAVVTAKAGGGRFAEGVVSDRGTSARLKTASDGSAELHWKCSPCAASYSIKVSASAEGRTPATENVDVRLRRR